MKKYKRKNYLIDKSFQLMFIARYIVIILISIILFACITGIYYFFKFQAGEAKYKEIILVKKEQVKQVTQSDGTKTELRIPGIESITSRFVIVFWPLFNTNLIIIIFIATYSIFFTHRMAGPVYRIRVSLDRMIEGDYDFTIRLRKDDFYQNLAYKLDEVRQKMKDTITPGTITKTDLKKIKDNIIAGKDNKEIIDQIDALL